MEEAKAAVRELSAKSGRHDTTIHELHKPAVTHEHVLPTEHHAETTVVEKEVHQHHHHVSVQPITHREVLPEKHHHKMIPVEHKEHRHGDHKAIEERLAAEAAQFRDVSEIGKTERTHEKKLPIIAMHIHHHVHEVIQPIIQKETIQPTIIHTTIPIHEVHHNEPKHHAATALPAMTMEDFKKHGGSLTGRAARTDRFDGEPHAETPEQHAKHAGLHRHGLTDSIAAEGVGAAATSTRTHGTHDGSLRNSADREREREHVRHSPGTGTAVAGAGAVGLAAAETRHHEHGNRVDPRVDHRVDPASRNIDRSGALDANRTITPPTSKLHKEPPAQFADTHAGSKMDSAVDRDIGVATTTNGDKVVRTSGDKPLNGNHHQSNFEAANVTKDTVPAAEITANERKKRTSLLGRLKAH